MRVLQMTIGLKNTSVIDAPGSTFNFIAAGSANNCALYEKDNEDAAAAFAF